MVIVKVRRMQKGWAEKQRREHRDSEVADAQSALPRMDNAVDGMKLISCIA